MVESKEFRVLSPTAILGYGFPEASFERGLNRNPNLIAVDAGSTDPGPYYLGIGKSFTDRAFVKKDLQYLLKAGVERKIPVVIGSAGGAGASSHLRWCQEIIEEIATEEKLSFKLGIIPADVEKKTVLSALARNKISPLKYVHELTPDHVKESTAIVAQMGIEPLQQALAEGCDVVLAGRSYDPAVFAALPVMLGYDPGLALHMGKILECAAIASTPGSGADCVLGILQSDSFILEPLNPKRRFTTESAAAHTLYEKDDPYHLPGPGGVLDLTDCKFKQLDSSRVEISGTRFVPSKKPNIKLEGARLVAYRSISIAGTRDSIMIKNIDKIIEEVREQIDEMMSRDKIDGDIYFHIYGKNGVMGEMEPLEFGRTRSHELGIIIETLGPTQDKADTLCSITRSTLLHYGYENRIATAGNLAFPFSPSDSSLGKVFEFSIYHLLELEENEARMFPCEVREIN